MIGALLRAEGRFAAERERVPWLALAALLVGGGWVYGFAMGFHDARPLQALFSAAKVPLLLAFSSLVCLPNFYVVNSVLGLRDDFTAALRGVVAAQATVAVTLASLAPVTLFAYVSTESYTFAVVLNGVFFALAAVAGQMTLNHHYRRLVARDRRHRIGRASWLVLYVFVAIQLAWVLRPFVGSPGQATRFFREDAWSNAYVVVVEVTTAFVREAAVPGYDR